MSNLLNEIPVVLEDVCINAQIPLQDKINNIANILLNIDRAFLYSGRLAIIKKGKLL